MKSIVLKFLKFLNRMYYALLFYASARDWQTDFGPVVGKKGESKVIKVHPQILFRGEKLIASDSCEKSGTGTRIVNIFVGQRSQMGNGLNWDVCHLGQEICMTVEFTEDCTFDASVFGKAVSL